MKKLICLFTAHALLTGCVGLSSVSVSDIVSSDKGSEIVAESSGMGFLSLTIPSTSSLEREAVKRLASQGASKNVSTRMSMRNFVIVQLYTVTAVGQK